MSDRPRRGDRPYRPIVQRDRKNPDTWTWTLIFADDTEPVTRRGYLSEAGARADMDWYAREWAREERRRERKAAQRTPEQLLYGEPE